MASLSPKIFVLGDYYRYKDRRVQFIMTSARTFNFLDPNTYRCVLPKAIRAKGYGNWDIPKYDIDFEFTKGTTKDITYEMGKEE